MRNSVLSWQQDIKTYKMIKKTVRGWIKNGKIPSQEQEKKYVENILIAAMRLKGVE